MNAITCLSVCEDTSVISLKCIIQNVTSHRVEDDVLRCKVTGAGIGREEAVIECESFWLLSEKKLSIEA